MDLVHLVEVVNEWESAPYRHKQEVLNRRLPELAISPGTFYRQAARLRRGPERRTPSTKGQNRPEYVAWVERIMRLKYTELKGTRNATTRNARRLALAWGLVPPEAAAMPEGTINRIAREKGWFPQSRRENRWEAEYPNRLHQVDASGSEYFYPFECRGGEWILRLRRAQLKNKEQMAHRKVWIWGLVDDHSGFRVCRYQVNKGENARDGLEFLKFAWAKEPLHAPFEGWPEKLYLDNGVLAKFKPFQEFMGELEVEVSTHEPYRPQAGGKVESGWRDLWRNFETLFLRDPNWPQREISLTELNQELAWFLAERNRRRHRHLSLSKEEAWLTVMHRGGVVSVAPGAWAGVARQTDRTLDAAGVFDFKTQVYQVKGLHSCRVTVYQGVLDGGLWVVDPETRQKFPAQPFIARVDGDYRSNPMTPLEELLATPLDIPAGVDTRVTFNPAIMPGEAGRENVLPLVRTKEVRGSEQLEIPLQAEGGHTGPPLQSLEDLAAGVELIEPGAGARGQGSEEQLFGSPLERYEHLLIKEFRQDPLSGDDTEFMAWFRAEHRDFMRTSGAAMEKQAQLRAVE